jgi:hypothetical protein
VGGWNFLLSPPTHPKQELEKIKKQKEKRKEKEKWC